VAVVVNLDLHATQLPFGAEATLLAENYVEFAAPHSTLKLSMHRRYEKTVIRYTIYSLPDI